MRMTRLLAAVLLVCLPVVLSSCFWFNWPMYTAGESDVEFHKVVSLEPGGTIQLDCPICDVEIQGSDRKDVEISARAEGSQSFSSSWFTFWGVKAAPLVSADIANNILTVKTGENPHLEQNIHILLLVPESVNLKNIHIGRGSLTVADIYGELEAAIGEGDLTVQNYSGSIQATVDKGSIEAEVLDLRDEDKIDLTVGEGGIGLALEEKVGAKLEASAKAGEVKGDFNLKAAPQADAVSVQLGTGKGTVTLKALNGNIEVRKIK